MLFLSLNFNIILFMNIHLYFYNLLIDMAVQVVVAADAVKSTAALTAVS